MGKFTKDTFFTFITNNFYFVLALASSVIIARALGPEGRGIYALVLLLPGFLITFTNLGIGQASVYFIGKKKYIPKIVFGNNIFLAFIITIFTIIIGLIIIIYFSGVFFPGIKQEYLLFGLFFIPFNIFFNFISDILLALQKIKKYNIIVYVFRALLFLLFITPFFVWLSIGVKTVITIELVSYFIACIVLFFWVKKETNGISLKINRAYVRDFFQYGIRVYLANLLSFVRRRLDIFLLNLYLNPFAVGVYSIARGLSEKILLVARSAGTVLFPRVASETKADELKRFTPIVCRNIIFISVLAAIVISIFTEHIINIFYAKEFLGAVGPLNILLIGEVAISAIITLGNDIAGRGKPMINAYINLAALAVNFTSLIILLPRFGLIGAAWAASASYVVLALITLFVYRQISGNNIIDIILIKKEDFKSYKHFILSAIKKI